MRTNRRPVPAAAAATATALAVVALGALLVLAAAVPVLAKESAEARLDAPIAMDTPGGTVILVGVMATFTEAEGVRPIEGTSIYLELTGRYGAITRAIGVPDPKLGHYTMRIEVPAGGPRDIEIGIRGSSDLPIRLMNNPFTFGGITPATAQLAPAVAPALTPFPRASAPAPAPVAVTPVRTPSTAPAQAPSPVFAIVAVAALLAVGGGIVALALTRRARGAARVAAPPQAPRA